MYYIITIILECQEHYLTFYDKSFDLFFEYPSKNIKKTSDLKEIPKSEVCV